MEGGENGCDDRVALAVTDDGVGHAAGLPSGTGMQLVQVLARQLGASISIMGGAGYTVTVSMPAAAFAASFSDLPSPKTAFLEGQALA